MKEKLEAIRAEARVRLEDCKTKADLEGLRVRFLGKKGELTALLRGMGALSPEERPKMGALVNEVRGRIEKAIEDKLCLLEEEDLARRLQEEQLDVTIPGVRGKLGKKHPLSQVLDEIKDIFLGMGFQIASGPEVEFDHYNFEALNMPKNHPARDTQDTLQVRVMEQQKPPIKVIAPGRVYRSDEVDATHSPLFHQIEGLVVDQGIRMSDLKGTLELFAKRLYGEEAVVRFRPHHFSFTEPSAEMDIRCFSCGGKGCRLCKGEGWIEILGAGMVHPKVLSGCNIDPEVYSGFAFGLGLERIVMRRFNIDDMRLFFENDLRLLEQF